MCHRTFTSEFDQKFMLGRSSKERPVTKIRVYSSGRSDSVSAAELSLWGRLGTAARNHGEHRATP